MKHVRVMLTLASSLLLGSSLLVLNVGAALTAALTSRFHPVGMFLTYSSSMYVFLLAALPIFLYLCDRRHSWPLDVFVAYVGAMLLGIEAFVVGSCAAILTYYYYWVQP